MRLRPSFQLGFLLPVIVILVAVADLGLRFLPLEVLAFRGWEVAERFRAADGSLARNVRFTRERGYGELAVYGNLPGLRQYRPESFVTDALGYRNPPELAVRPVDAILVGSSYSLGIGITDEQMPSVQISEQSGLTVYNASLLWFDFNIGRVRAVARELQMDGGLVILEWLDRNDYPPPRHAPPPHPCYRALGKVGLDGLCARARGLVYVSPLKILAQKALRALQNDTVLPNLHASAVVERRLRNGEPILFPLEDVQKLEKQQAEYARAQAFGGPLRPERAEADFIRWLREELRKDNLDLLVVLVPNKYSVYQPLLDDPGPAPADPTPYLTYLEDEIRGVGVPVVNLSTTLRAAAAAALERDDYVYWRDDAHWNADGIAIAAREISRAWWELRATPAR
jgi:hypothetical protein